MESELGSASSNHPSVSEHEDACVKDCDSVSRATGASISAETGVDIGV